MAATYPQTTFGDRLRRTRLDARVDAQEMAELLLVGRNTVSKWENDHHPPPTRKLRRWVEIVVERTGYTADEVLTFLDDETAAVLLAEVIAERRHTERRTPTRKRKQHPTCSPRVTRFPRMFRELLDVA